MKVPVPVNLSTIREDVAMTTKTPLEEVNIVFEAEINGTLYSLAYNGVSEDDDGNIVICASTDDMIEVED